MSPQDLLAFRMMAEVALKEQPDDSLAKNFLRVLDAFDAATAERSEDEGVMVALRRHRGEAEAERDKAMAQIEATVKGDRHHLKKRQEAEEVLQDFNIEECEGCFGTGHDKGDTKNDEACTYCAGHGEIITGGYPKALRAAQDSIDAGE